VIELSRPARSNTSSWWALRRRQARPELLHRVCRKGAPGLRRADARLRQVRFFDQDLGAIDGIPRLLDVGQCNDAYSPFRSPSRCPKAFNCGSTICLCPDPVLVRTEGGGDPADAAVSCIKNIRLGPSLPAFVTPNVLNVLVEKFNIAPIKTPDEDLKAILK